MQKWDKTFNKIKIDFEKNKDFAVFLNETFSFAGRKWTYGQFLYKYFFDEVSKFSYYLKKNEKHPKKLQSELSPEKLKLAKKLEFLIKNNLIIPGAVFDEKIKNFDMFDGNEEKKNFYTELFTGGRSTKENPCYWHPVAQFQFLYIEEQLMSKMGMNEKQVRTLMQHCEKKREDLEKYYLNHKPKQFMHNSIKPPEKMGDKLPTNLRCVDNWINMQKYCFLTAAPYSFHAGLPIKGENGFIAWSRFKPEVVVFYQTPESFKEKIKTSYNYKVTQTDSIRPVISLWGDGPYEWVSTESLNYDKNDVQKETIDDLIKQGKKFYLISDENLWKNGLVGASNLSVKQASELLDTLCKKGKATLYMPEGKGLKQNILNRLQKQSLLLRRHRNKQK